MGLRKKPDGSVTTITARVPTAFAHEVRQTADILGMNLSDYLRILLENDVAAQKSTSDWQRRVDEHKQRRIAELEEEIAALKEKQRSLKAR